MGQVVAPFGVKGELKANILTEFPDRFKRLDTVILTPFNSIEPGLAPTAALNPATVRSTGDAGSTAKRQTPRPPKGPTTFRMESSQIHKGQLVFKLEGVDTYEAAEALRGCWLLVPTEQAASLPTGAYYIYQIVGLEVYTTEGTLLGAVADVITTAGNDVYVVRGPGVTEPSGELLVPAVKVVVKSIDVPGGRITIAPVEEWT